MRRGRFLWLMVWGVFWTVVLATPTFAAYSAHQDDQDINNFLKVYPFAKGSKLDDCALCHKGGTIGSTTYGSCDYCHHIGDASQTLNPYGVAYLGAGGHSADQADQAALKAIENEDSDNDGFPNLQEIQSLTFPGYSTDYPGLKAAPAIVLDLERILHLPYYSEFLLLNAKKDTDWYARYGGVKIIDLLRYAGVPITAKGITVFAPDGFSKYFPMDVQDPQTDPLNVQYDVKGPYPYGYFYPGLDFVNYAFVPSHLHGNQIPDTLYMLLAYLRDGNPLTPGKINPTTLSLDGEGPYRLIPPQKIAGRPDRPMTSPTVGDGWDYDKNKDHNAGSSVRSVTAIRVEPLPDNTNDFQWTEGGWNLVDNAKLVIYGAINPQTYSVLGKVSDSNGRGIPDVTLTFGLLSLGQVGQASSSSIPKGFFTIKLPAGEYTVIPSKGGCTFTPSSLSISLSGLEQIAFTGSCQ